MSRLGNRPHCSLFFPFVERFVIVATRQTDKQFEALEVSVKTRCFCALLSSQSFDSPFKAHSRMWVNRSVNKGAENRPKSRSWFEWPRRQQLSHVQQQSRWVVNAFSSCCCLIAQKIAAPELDTRREVNVIVKMQTMKVAVLRVHFNNWVNESGSGGGDVLMAWKATEEWLYEPSNMRFPMDNVTDILVIMLFNHGK